MARLPEPLDRIFAQGLGCLRSYYDRPACDAKRLGATGGETDLRLAALENAAAAGRFAHDEPWVTMMALFGLFGDQSALSGSLAATNALLAKAYSARRPPVAPPVLSAVHSIRAEVRLPENLRFREYLANVVFTPQPVHLYRDRREALRAKLEHPSSSLEGNTNVDAIVSGTTASRRTLHVFIEAKFKSDISTDITYLPVRNQIARNIDCAMDRLTGQGKDFAGLQDLWFCLLTPGIFRTEPYGGPVDSPWGCFQPARSRLYCYKMNDYLDPARLRADLPHWQLKDEQWEMISQHIGWLTFEDMAAAALAHGTVPPGLEAAFRSFFADRALPIA